jgi:predicted esterase
MAAHTGRRLLNILCLHGYGGNSAVFEYQSRRFRKVFADSMKFHILQAPSAVEVQSPHPTLAARGLLPPYFAWYRIGRHHIDEQGQHQLQVCRAACAPNFFAELLPLG